MLVDPKKETKMIVPNVAIWVCGVNEKKNEQDFSLVKPKMRPIEWYKWEK